MRKLAIVGSHPDTRENAPYDDLCWMYAERKIFADNNQIPSDEELRCKAAEVFVSCCEYDVLCYLIAELDIKYGKEFREAKKF